MLIIGLTGGIGCGKSAVLKILANDYDAYIIEADSLAHDLMEPGQKIYNSVVDAFGKEILATNKEIDRKKLGSIVFNDKEKLELLNSISHPLVKESILEQIEAMRECGRRLFVIEAALLIQDGYKDICDIMCYVYASLDTRIDRLCKYRGYTREKALSVINSQPDEDFYKSNCDYLIDNSFDLEATKINIKKIMKKEGF